MFTRPYDSAREPSNVMVGGLPDGCKMAASLGGNDIRAVLIDISGVLYDGKNPIKGSLEALAKYVPDRCTRVFPVDVMCSELYLCNVI